MLHKLGRLLQLAGLIILPIAMAGNLADPQGVGEGRMLLIAGAGAAVFCVGWLLQQAARSK
jgi:hypothetical protein